MPKYTVNLAKTIWYSIEVEADDEEAALDLGHAQAPRLGANACGWGEKWSISDDDEWLPYDEFYENYDPEQHGRSVEEVGA
jgi:hypothetical protein